MSRWAVVTMLIACSDRTAPEATPQTPHLPVGHSRSDAENRLVARMYQTAQMVRHSGNLLTDIVAKGMANQNCIDIHHIDMTTRLLESDIFGDPGINSRVELVGCDEVTLTSGELLRYSFEEQRWLPVSNL
jgi:hypothetical protein